MQPPTSIQRIVRTAAALNTQHRCNHSTRMQTISNRLELSIDGNYAYLFASFIPLIKEVSSGRVVSF